MKIIFLAIAFFICSISYLNAQIELDGSNFNNQIGINGPPPAISPVLASAIGEHPDNAMGYNNSIKIIGDVNNDGFDDILIGAQWEHEESPLKSNLFSKCGNVSCQSGRIYLILGRTQQKWESIGQNVNLDDLAFLIFKTNSEKAYLGARLGKGDLNKDGINDIIFSAYGYTPIEQLLYRETSNGLFFQGKVYILAGRENSEWDDFKDVNSSGSIILNPSHLDKIINIDPNSSVDNDIQIYTDPSSAKFVTFIGQHQSYGYYDDMLGSALACQDLNGDGNDDLIIGAMGAEASHCPQYTFKMSGDDETSSAQNPGKGRVYIVKGALNFFDDFFTTKYDENDPLYKDKAINLPIVDYCNVYFKGGTVECAYKTDVLTTIGEDTDHNKYDNINEMLGFAIEPVTGFESSTSKGFIVGQQNLEGNFGYIHQRSVYYVSSSDIQNWNIKDQGFIKDKAMNIINNPNTYPEGYLPENKLYGWNINSWNNTGTFDENKGICRSFFGSVLATADFDGDGYTDIIIGDPAYHANLYINVGRIDIILGGIDYDKIIQTKHIVSSDITPTEDLNNTDQPSIFSYIGAPKGASLGVSVSNIGDMNGDNRDDIIIGCTQVKGDYSRLPSKYTRRDAIIIYGHDIVNNTKSQKIFKARVEQYYCLKPPPTSNFNIPFKTIFDNQFSNPWKYTFFLGEETARYNAETAKLTTDNTKLSDCDDLTSAASWIAGGGDINSDGKPDFVICDQYFSTLKNKENDYIKNASDYSENIKEVNIGKVYFVNGDFSLAAYQRNKYDWIKNEYDLQNHTSLESDLNNFSYPWYCPNKNALISGLNNMSDLWIRDQLFAPYIENGNKINYEDRGFEPNPIWKDLWTSPDIWVVNNLYDDGSTVLKKFEDTSPKWFLNMGLNYEQPEFGYTTHGTVTEQKPVYIFVRIRNRGFEFNDVLKENLNNVHLYWSLDGSQGWYDSWINNILYFVNPDMTVTSFPGGDEILCKVDPEHSPVSPSILVAPGEYQIISFKWYPPDPTQYPPLYQSWDHKLHVCFLARITGPSINGGSPDGMTFIETTDLYRNVALNNNIAWKNMLVIPVPKIEYNISGTTHWLWPPKDIVYLLNGLDEGSNTIFKIRSVEKSFSEISQYGKAYLNLPKSFYDECIVNNASFTNLDLKLVSNDTVNFEVTSDSAWISGINLNPNQIIPLRFYFKPNEDMNFDNDVNISYNLIHEKEGRSYPVGGSTFKLILKHLVDSITITTANVTSITQTTATCGGEITSVGGCPITERGVCWSTSSMPTIEDQKTNDGSGTGSFESLISGLQSNTIYFLRAYAGTNSGTIYGNNIMFITSPSDP